MKVSSAFLSFQAAVFSGEPLAGLVPSLKGSYTTFFFIGGDLMARAPQGESKRPRPPAQTPEARENQMIAAAVDLAERQIAAGTASSQVITHYLKMGSMRERIEREKLARENELLQSRIRSMESEGVSQQMYEKALNAFRGYSGSDPVEEFYED